MLVEFVFFFATDYKHKGDIYIKNNNTFVNVVDDVI